MPIPGGPSVPILGVHSLVLVGKKAAIRRIPFRHQPGFRGALGRLGLASLFRMCESFFFFRFRLKLFGHRRPSRQQGRSLSIWESTRYSGNLEVTKSIYHRQNSADKPT